MLQGFEKVVLKILESEQVRLRDLSFDTKCTDFGGRGNFKSRPFNYKFLVFATLLSVLGSLLIPLVNHTKHRAVRRHSVELSVGLASTPTQSSFQSPLLKAWHMFPSTATWLSLVLYCVSDQFRETASCTFGAADQY